MSSKEKVLAIRPGALCEFYRRYGEWECWVIKDSGSCMGHSYLSEEEAWAAAYKYLTK